MKALKAVLILALIPFLAGCESLGLESDPSYSKTEQDQMYKNGSLASDNGGINLFGGPDKKALDNNGIGVNAYLWRAKIDTVSFMPIASADPFGGVIITDWYSPPDQPDQRMKLNIFIRGRDLRADGVAKVSVFRQTREGTNWVDATVVPATAGSLENTILTKARQIHLAQKQAQ